MPSLEPRGWPDRRLFQFVLSALGLGLEVACRLSDSFRAQVTRELTVQIASADGVVHHYAFSPRTVASRRGPTGAPTLSLCFDNARQGWLALISPHAVGRIVDALLVGNARYEGNAVLLLWFYGLTRFVLPIGRTAPLSQPPPDAYVTCDPNSKVAGRITREPPATTLDPAWTVAHRQRAKMAMIRGSAGEPIPMW